MLYNWRSWSFSFFLSFFLFLNGMEEMPRWSCRILLALYIGSRMKNWRWWSFHYCPICALCLSCRRVQMTWERWVSLHVGHAWRRQLSPFYAEKVFTSHCVLQVCKCPQSIQLYMSCAFCILCGVTCHSHHTDLAEAIVCFTNRWSQMGNVLHWKLISQN